MKSELFQQIGLLTATAQAQMPPDYSAFTGKSEPLGSDSDSSDYSERQGRRLSSFLWTPGYRAKPGRASATADLTAPQI